VDGSENMGSRKDLNGYDKSGKHPFASNLIKNLEKENRLRFREG